MDPKSCPILKNVVESKGFFPGEQNLVCLSNFTKIFLMGNTKCVGPQRNHSFLIKQFAGSQFFQMETSKTETETGTDRQTDRQTVSGGESNVSRSHCIGDGGGGPNDNIVRVGFGGISATAEDCDFAIRKCKRMRFVCLNAC